MRAMSRKGVGNCFAISLYFRFAIQLETGLEICFQWSLRSLQLEETEQLITMPVKLATCIKTAWDRVRNMFAMMFVTITTIWRPDFNKPNCQCKEKRV